MDALIPASTQFRYSGRCYGRQYSREIRNWDDAEIRSSNLKPISRRGLGAPWGQRSFTVLSNPYTHRGEKPGILDVRDPLDKNTRGTRLALIL